MAWVYIVRCRDNSYYVGSTLDLERRLWQHNRGEGAEYTKRRRPVVLVWAAEYPNVADAFGVEKKIQNWSGPSARRSSRGGSTTYRCSVEVAPGG